jgi:hypothetical protein
MHPRNLADVVAELVDAGLAHAVASAATMPIAAAALILPLTDTSLGG